ncbi:MAG: pantoate--beta-alanine ligase, partial [Acetobacteraceae bacterium]
TSAEFAYFGEKDWQQLQVVRRMVADLHLPVEVLGVPTVRADDGLALSSRNALLTPEERMRAPALYRQMIASAAAIATGEPVSPRLAAARATLAVEGFVVDYLDLVYGPSLRPLTVPAPGVRLIAAARLGAVRLLDNVAVTISGKAANP